ncbi:MAG: hypothetical protein AAGI23_11605 [Bacteroidota bacterium]
MQKIVLFIFILSSLPLLLSAQNALVLGTYQANTTVGEEVCVQMYGRQFNGIVSMQYTLQWNPKHLKYRGVQNFGLRGLSDQNFGTQQQTDGLLTAAWYDPQLRGISLKEGSVVYEVCFEVIGGKGETTKLAFVETPTTIEVSNAQSQLIPLQSEVGKINIR